MRIRNVMLGLVCFAGFLPEVLVAAALPDVEKIVRPYVDQGQAPAIVVGIVNCSGPKYYCFGTSAGSGSPKVDEKTLFEIGSITKVFTSLILADMVNDGELQLDDPLDKFLPGKVPGLSRNGKTVTLADLATHTSGLPAFPSNMAGEDAVNPYAEYDDAALNDYLAQGELKCVPGQHWNYSGWGVGLLGNLLAQKTGKPYERLVIERVCKPLGMNCTVQTLTPELKQQLAQGHAGNQTVTNWDFQALAGCGALRSNAEDLLKFVSAHLGFRKSSLDSAIELALKVRKPTPTPSFTQALGWEISSNDGDEIVWHAGGTGGYRSLVGFRPSIGIGVVVLCNSTFDVDAIGLHLLDDRYPLPNAHPDREH
jgi:D-alanyl-D-alanine-carboxypeptidase/D-alanyl-D-alanine-endopeptidase